VAKRRKRSAKEGRHNAAWTTLQLAIVSCIVVSPFWFLAGDIRDGDELYKTGVGAGLLAIGGVWRMIRGGST
jgi:hypothetical protein